MVGKLMIIGGHEDKKGEKQILKAFAMLCDFKKIGILTTASNVPDEVFADYKNVFETIGVQEVIHFKIESKNDTDHYIHHLDQISGLFISGGDQRQLADILLESTILELIKEKRKTGLMIGGTSAGATIMGKKMILESKEENDQVNELTIGDGFGFVENLIIDQHFSQRGRFGRLVYEVGLTAEMIGIGIDENTAIICDENQLSVVGSNVVAIMDGRDLDFIVKKDEQNEMTISGIKLHLLSSAYKYSLSTGKVTEEKI
ncbi:cyanophycinase [Alkalihalobacillus sp. AL-G]|uniref:cyanophycinase n=1 Tax=Alkalihalobacillus sp. AL-G TaxID=2926399 RepID=UPI00272CA234|nr:cyanophycinase [Alkalihalobacillus sp. AL-G]WLD91646.1 cyanophycinase [Alkalihalobacillus sp. AL-G]